ncbi:hypothetical protein ACLEPN_30685 [Myxococcus sp. 1LA]
MSDAATKGSSGAKPISLKVPKDVGDYLDEVMRAGGEKSATIHRSVRLFRDLLLNLPVQDWAEIEKRAKVAGVGEGAVVAELLHAALQATVAEFGSQK